MAVTAIAIGAFIGQFAELRNSIDCPGDRDCCESEIEIVQIHLNRAIQSNVLSNEESAIMPDYNEELARRIDQFAGYLKKMYHRSHEEVCGPCFLIFSESSPENCSDGDHLVEQASPALELSLATAETTGFFNESLNGDLVFSTKIPDEIWRQDDLQKRFIQFSFERDWFCVDMPLQTLFRAEAEVIMRSRKGFFFLSDRPDFTLYEEDVEGYDPFRKIYIYGDELAAAEDIAFVFFHVWKFPVDWRFFVKAAAFGEKQTDWEWNAPIA